MSIHNRFYPFRFKKGMKTPKPDMDIIRARLKTIKAYIEGEK